MNACHAAAITFLAGFFTLIGSAEQHREVPSAPATCLTDCPPYNEEALRHLRLILMEEDFHDFVLEAGAEGVNLDSLTAVMDTAACTALDSALTAISAQADTAYYAFARYDRAYFEDGGLYFAVEWPKPSEDPWQIVGGPSYFTAFGSDFVKRAEQSL